MITSSSSGAVYPAAHAASYYVNTEREAHARTVQNPQYDSVSLSPAPTGDSRFMRDMISRISKEVRTATTTGDIQKLRQQVISGEYRPDPMAIAARILYLGEG